METHLYELDIDINHFLSTKGDIRCKISHSDAYRINVSSSQGVMGFSGSSKKDLQTDLLNGLAFFSKDMAKYKHAVIVIAELITNLDRYFENLSNHIEEQTVDVLEAQSIEELLESIFGGPVRVIHIK